MSQKEKALETMESLSHGIVLVVGDVIIVSESIVLSGGEPWATRGAEL